MRKRELIAVIMIIVIIGAVGAYILISMPSGADNYQTQSVEIIDSYVMAEGEFDFIDLYTWGETSGSDHFRFHAHIIDEGIKYEINAPRYDSTDSSRNGQIFRISLWIDKNGTFTEHRFMVIMDITYDLEFRGVGIQILITEY